jgi:hypothetical protein
MIMGDIGGTRWYSLHGDCEEKKERGEIGFVETKRV